MASARYLCRRTLIPALLGAALGLCPALADDPSGPAVTTKPATFEQVVRPFLTTYCFQCHGRDLQKGERRFDTLAPQIHGDGELVDFQDILDQLNLGEMPPEQARQPAASERRAVIAWLTGHIAQYHADSRASSQGTVLRRLNSREYRNTVGDLFRLNMTMFDPTTAFPRDQLDEHLDNVGETLVMSGHLLDRYLDAAEQVVEKALRVRERPATRTWSFHDNFQQQPEIDQVHRRTNNFSHITLYDVINADKHEGAYGPILEFREGVPHDGLYEIRFRAQAVNRINPYDPEFLGLDPQEPLRLGIVAGHALAGPLHKPQPMEPLLAELDLADESRTYTVRVWLDQGYTPRFTFQNGLMDARNLWTRILKKYPEQFPKLKRPGIVEARYTAIKHGKLPQIHVDDIEIEGPIIEQWPTPAHHAALGDDCEQILATQSMSAEQMRRQLNVFFTRACRRPAQPDEIERLMQLIALRQAAGCSTLEAWGDALQAVLCSPGFLYLDEQDTDGRLTSHALASRLSYFLWSSLPDQELLDLADSGDLRHPDVLAAQVQRLLTDARSEAFIDGFLESWLTLRDLGSMPPDRGDFAAYYQYNLGPAMRQESRLFTRHLLEENRPITDFLDARYTFLNNPLARLYGLEPPGQPGFHRVALPDVRRGGLLGQASVLTVSANGIETSPVIRGVWLLDNILGTPPSPPPPDVEPLDPDVRGTQTVREQLAKHRSHESCNDCHRKIDPLGFALENFDPIGRWRTSYDGRQPIDASGELPNGMAFENIVGLKGILVEQNDLFVRALTNKLLAYGMGRQVEPADRPRVDELIEELAGRGYGFRDLITLVVLSEPFRAP